MRVWRAEYSLSFSVALSWYFSSSLSLFAVSVLVSLSVSRFLFLCLLLSFSFSFPFSSLSLCFSLSPQCLPRSSSLSPSRYLSVVVSVSTSVSAQRLWGSIALPPSRRTGAGTSGVPAASFARGGLTARVHRQCTEGRVSRRTLPQPGTRLRGPAGLKHPRSRRRLRQRSRMT